MAKVNWTKEQSQAIYEKGSNILVAAAAGSGKTAVLVERMINKIINENVDIDKILIVTFTNAAAAEMRERILDSIYKKLDDDPDNVNLQRQITLLNKSNICTIDSFCLDVIRNNFYELEEGISPNFRIADTTEIELLKQEKIEDIFEKKYENNDKEFLKLINTYTTYRDDTPLKEIVLKIYNYIQSNPFPDKWLEDKIEMFDLGEKLEEDFSKTPWGEILLEDIECEVIDAISILENVEEDLSFDPDLDKFQQTIRNDIDMLENFRRHLNSWDDSFEIFNNMKFITWPRQKVESELKDIAKETRDSVKKKITDKKSKISKILICDSKEANQDIYDMYQILKKLKNLIFEFEIAFKKAKKEKNIVDFNDVEHFALKILLKNEDGIESVDKIIPSDVALKYQEKFQEIAIDEYQDSNLVQEFILNSISRKNNIFMVGDVKQSIYKFRQAMPTLFLDKYEKYKNKENFTDNDDLKIQLFKNFRSRENILNFTNLIFKSIMSNVLGEIEYTEEEFLNLGASYKNVSENLTTEINIINKVEEVKDEDDDVQINDVDEEHLEDIEVEARFVANRIKKLIDDKFQVIDKKTGDTRNITYKDIVVLLRSTSTVAPIFEQELINLQIPVFSDSSSQYLDSIEIETIISLLKIIDNPIQDIPLISVMRSNIGGFTDDDLVEIRLSDKYDNFYNAILKARINVDKELNKKIDEFIEKLSKWREEKEYLALDELIWKIYEDTGFFNYVGLMPNGELRQANLKLLFEKAKQYETASFKGLYNFIKFIEKLKMSSGDMGSAKIIGENDDVVRIMSIHKSKGLEFPVVILANAGKKFNLQDLNQNILLHQDMGIGVKYIDYNKQVEYDTLTKAALKVKILNENLSEEMRILYVALTRAKEKLIVTAFLKDYQKQKEKMYEEINRYSLSNNKINPILIQKYRKYIDWILLAFYYKNEDSKYAYINEISATSAKKSFIDVSNNEIDVIQYLKKNKKKFQDKNLVNKLEYVYPNIESTILPTKLSVSQIKDMQNPKEDIDVYEEVNEEDKSLSEVELNIPEFIITKSDKITGARKGTIMHLCMQKLNEKEKYDIDKIDILLNSLVNTKIISVEEKNSINKNKILAFTKSKIWNELIIAKEIYKEKPFYLEIPANEIYNGKATNDILVQGIIDLYYEDKDGKITLVDYKTDFANNESELIEKYSKQLEIYKLAIEKSMQKKVSNTYIYSTYLEKEIKVFD